MYYSAIPDPLLPPEPGVLEAIQQFYPEAQYCREVKVYRSPSNRTHVFTRHAIASRIWFPRSKKPPFRIDIPEAYPYARPNMLDFVVQHGWHEGGNTVLPGGYAAWSWGLVGYLHQIFDRETARERQNRAIRMKLEKQKKEEEYAAKEWEGRVSEDMKYWEKRLNEISDVEIDEYARSLKAIREERQKEWAIAVAKAKAAAPKSIFLGSGRKDH